jgi:hypothetical protein
VVEVCAISRRSVGSVLSGRERHVMDHLFDQPSSTAVHGVVVGLLLRDCDRYAGTMVDDGRDVRLIVDEDEPASPPAPTWFRSSAPPPALNVASWLSALK